MANDLSAFLAEAWTKRMVERLNQVNVMVGLSNRNWEGDLRQVALAHVRTVGNISMAAYTRGDSIVYENLAPLAEVFTVAGAETFAFNIDDLDKAQNDINAMDAYLTRAVEALNRSVEAKILGAHSLAAVTIGAAPVGTGGILTPVIGTGTLAGQIASVTITAGGTGYTTVPVLQVVGGNGFGATFGVHSSAGVIDGITVLTGGHFYTIAPQIILTTANGIALDGTSTAGVGVYPLFTRARTIMGKQSVPNTPGSRWAVVSNGVAEILLNDVVHFIRATDLGDRVVQTAMLGGGSEGRTAGQANGFIGMCAGFSVYEINHPPSTSTLEYLLFGNNEAISYASQITELEMLRLQTTFADAARGLLLHDKFVSGENARRLVRVIGLKT